MKKITKKLILAYVCTLCCIAGSGPVFGDSLWSNQPNQSNTSMFTDRKASQPGDIITVLIVETAEVSQNASSSRDRSSTISGEVTNWSMPVFSGGLKGASTIANLPTEGLSAFPEVKTKRANAANLPIWEIDTSNKFSGGGKYTGDYTVKGQITTRVVDVLPNKNLVVEGTSEVFINSERNTVNISGIIRPDDIDVNNTVLSTKMADAKVRILGRGPLNDKTRKGLFETVLDWFWPF